MMAGFQLMDLMDTICSKMSDKEQRLQSCSALQYLLLTLGDGRQLGKDPFSVLYRLEELFFSRLSNEVKKSVAGCLGTMGYIMGYKCKDYVNWLFEKYDASVNDDIRAYYLHAILTTLQHNTRNRKMDEKSLAKTMSDVHKCLGVAENSKLLVPLLELIGILATSYASLFSPHFKDVVDILAGWYIDTEQSSAVFRSCEETLKKLQPFWLENMEFTLDMLSQFLEDAEMYIEDSSVSSVSVNQSPPEDCILKASSLLRVYKIIMETIADYFIVTAENVRYVAFIDEALRRTQTCVDGALERPFCEVSDVASAAAAAGEVLLNICRLHFNLVVPRLFRMVCQLCNSQRLEEESLLQVLSLVKTSVTKLSAEVIAPYIKDLIGPEGCLLQLRFHHCLKIANYVLDIYRLLFQPKAITSLQEVYRCTVGELQSCLRVIKNSTRKSEIQIQEDGCSIDLGLSDVPVFEREGALANPATTEWVIVFLACALTELGNAKNSLIGMWGLTPNQFALISQKIPMSEKWFMESCRAGHYSLLYTLKAHCDKHDQFMSNSDLVTDSCRTPMLANAQTGRNLSVILGLLENLLRCAALADETRVIVLCSKVTAKRDERYAKLLENVPFAELVRVDGVCTNHEGLVVSTQNKVASGSMAAQHFRIFMDFLLNSSPPKLLEENGQKLWYENMKLIMSECTPESKTDLLNDSGPRKVWQWALWECAQYCVANRLKTTLGKPADTFTVIENRIRSLANECQRNSEKNEDSRRELTNGERELSKSRSLQWFSVRSLCNFVENLDKAIYNASEGTAFSLTPASKYTPNIELLLILTTEALSKMHCGQALHGLHSWTKGFLKVRAPWIKTSVDMACGKYEIAAGAFRDLLIQQNCTEKGGGEEAVPEENNNGSVKNNSSSLSAQESRFIGSQIMECYMSLRDWSSAKEFVEMAEKKGVESFEAVIAGNNGCRLTCLEKLGSFELFSGEEAEDRDRDKVGRNPPVVWDLRESVGNLECQLTEVLKDPKDSVNWSESSGREPGKWLPVARHAAKLLYAAEEGRNGFGLLSDAVARTLDTGLAGAVASSGPNEQLLDGVSRRLVRMSLESGQGGMREELSRSLLRLGEWMQGDKDFGDLLLANEDSLFIKLIEEQLNLAENFLGALDSASVVGALLTLSAHICPELSKAQRALADWAYKVGKKAVEGSCRDEHVLLTSEELNVISGALPEDYTDDIRESVISLVSSLKSDDSSLKTQADLIQELLAVCPNLAYVDTLVDIWDRANRRLFLFYDSAATAYFAYLRFSAENSTAIITATLRLLRLLVKHVQHLHPALQEEFEKTDPKCWRCVMPQLFARLNHPSAVVRDTLCRLLERMALSVPALVSFPAVIGSQGGGGASLKAQSSVDRVIFDESEETAADNISGNNDESLMVGCCQKLVEVIEKQDAELVQDVKILVHELQRITLLREEKWFSVLGHLQHEISKRLKQLNEETEKTMRSTYLSETEKQEIVKDKADIFTRMMFKTLEDLVEKTTGAPETPNESWFVTQYGCLLKNALVQYRKDPANPSLAWEPFSQLLEILNQRSTKRSSLSLDMKDISPVLHGLSRTKIPMPGREVDGSRLTVAGVARPVSILPTKTRPKKLSLVGSDGKQYAYLFKGLEDLHLDERIMQFLRICNMMLCDRKKFGNSYFARNYSVTPLGSRSGLIQWVDGATPIFSIYRKWQIREASASGSGHMSVTRPSELYYGKLAPALEQVGVKDLENRNKWPLNVLRTVLTELISETPKNLLAKEIWCRCDSAEGWWCLTQRFARSAAVMSMIGYVIGLGDRHLDNVLVDLQTGDVVHIDYNICFEKGKHLRVPETIPFRMTLNLKSALGPTGVEGVFRLSCEDVMKVLRAGRETLLTLLEAFVYDPLVDWAATQDVGTATFLGPNVAFTVYGAQKSDEGQITAMELANKMFKIRQKELGIPWIANKESLSVALHALIESLAKMSARQEELRKCTEEQHGLEEDIALQLAESDPQQLKMSLEAVQQKQKLLAETVSAYGLDLRRSSHDVRSALSTHHNMMLDIRYVLKSLAKLEDQAGLKQGRFSIYIGRYKDFSEQLAGCLRIIGDKTEWEPDEVKMALNGLTSVLASLDQIYDALLAIDSWQPKEDAIKTETTDDSGKSGEQKEERNVQAMNIWRRVRLKLEGRDPSSVKKSTIQEQVDYVIRQSTDLDNLATMYEGWTSWV